MIRRSIAGLILGPSLLIGSLAWSGFVALRTVFEPDRSRDVAEELLANDEVRSQLAANIASAVEASVPPQAPLSSEQADAVAAEILANPEVEQLVLTAFTATHGAFLGEGDAPRTLDLAPVADSVRAAIIDVAPALEPAVPQAAAPSVTLPTDRIPDAGPLRRLLQRAVPILAVAAIAGALLALVTTSDRASVLTKAGVWALSTAAFYLVVGFGLPWLLRRVAPDQLEVLAALITALLRTTVIPSMVLALVGAGMVASAIVWPSRDRQRQVEPGDVRPASTAQGPRQPVWPGPVPQPLVYPDPGHAPRPVARVRPTEHRPDADATSVIRTDPEPRSPRPAAAPRESVPSPTAGQPDPGPADRPRPETRLASDRRRQEARRAPDPLRPRPDLPPPLPTVASVSRSQRGEPEDPSGDRTGPAPASDEQQATPAPSGAGRLPTTEQAQRPAKWMPPTWVEGHGWVLDPADPRPPPSNARWVEGIGYVVPGPPP